jgi:Tfp pilus assembly protein PilZ
MHLASIALRSQDPRAASPLRSRDRRRHERVAARGLASHVQAKDASAAGLPVENISMGGLFVRSASPLDPGTPVMLQVVRPGLKRAIQATGRVVSVVTPQEARERQVVAGMGISLDCVDREAQSRLRALVDDLAVVAATTPVKPAAEAATAVEMTRLELAEAQDAMAAQARRIERLEAELKTMRAELLRRNRTIGDLANRLSAYEKL